MAGKTKDPVLKTLKIGNGLVSALAGLLAVVLILYSGYVLYDSFATEYGAISSYNPGILMYGIGAKGDWTYVRYYDHYGWIFSEFLTEQ